MLRLICYDLDDNKRRTKLAKKLMRAGFDRIQFSVFVGEVDEPRYDTLWKEVTEIMKEVPAAKVYSIGISPLMFEKMHCIGEPVDTAYILGKLHTLYFS